MTRDHPTPTPEHRQLISDFDYNLPEELIAQHPLQQRDASRMLVLDRNDRSWCDTRFIDFAEYVRPGDLVVLNNTRVFPARLIGKRETSGGRVELFLLYETEPSVWQALVRPARRLLKNAKLSFGDGRLRAEIIEVLQDGQRLLRFEHRGPLEEAFDALGQTPLPPYIKRGDDDSLEDRERYQTVYARTRGAIAAPTAGLHFTDRVLNRIVERGARTAEITLHVGYGTFEPVRVDDVSDHAVAPERYEITSEAAQAINETRACGGRVIAVGTTTTRALESAIANGSVAAGTGMARLTITPGYKFRAVNALLTNFHLPRSSLLILISAFAGREFILAAYDHAVRERYRFYSYGDCMLII